MDTLDYSQLQKAIKSLQEGIHIYDLHKHDAALKDLLRDSVIQRFEYTFEMSWKMLQRWIRLYISPADADPLTKKDLFRLASRQGLIDDPQTWFLFIEARNISVHTYNEDNAKKAFDAALTFATTAPSLLQHMQEKS